MKRYAGAKLLFLSMVLALPLAACSSSNGGSAVAGQSATATDSADANAASPSGGTDSSPQELTVWHYWDGNNADVFQQMVDQYHSEHPNVTVKVVTVPNKDLLTKVQTGATTGTLPDIAIGDLVWMPRFAATGKAVDLKSLVPAATWQDLYPEMVKMGTNGSKQLSIPVSANDLALMYNKSLFTAAGLDPANPPKTWEELKAASATIREKTGKPGFELFTQPGTDGEGVTWNFQVNLWQAGGEFLNADNTKAAFNSDAGREALQFWVDMIDSKGSPLAPWGEFEKGKAASAQEGSWMVGIWQGQPPFDFGVAPIPYPADGEPATNMGGEQAMVFSTDKAKQQAAADFLTWFDDPKQSLTWSEKTGFLPVRKSVGESEDYVNYVNSNSPMLKPFVEALASAHSRPNSPVYPQVSLAFAKEVEQAEYHKKSVEQALADAESEVNAILASAS